MTGYLTGLPAWVVQRLSALYLLSYILVMGITITLSTPLDFTRWHHLMSHPAVTVATALAFLALLLHSWVGLRDVTLDYAGRLPALRLTLLALLGLWLLALAFWMLHVVLELPA